MNYVLRRSTAIFKASQTSSLTASTRGPLLSYPSRMTKRGPLDRYFYQLDSNKKSKPAAQAQKPVATDCLQTNSAIAANNASSNPRKQQQQEQQQGQQQPIEKPHAEANAAALPLADDQPANNASGEQQAVVVVRAETAVATQQQDASAPADAAAFGVTSVTAASGESHVVVAMASSSKPGAGKPGITGAAAPQQPAAPAAAATGALGALMAAAKGHATAVGSNTTQQLNVQQMQDIGNRNQAAAQAIVQASTAASKQPQLKSLLVESSWLKVLDPEFEKPYMKQLQGFLETEWAGGTVYPPKDLIFRAFNEVPFDQVRVVILGQDPYINPGEAMGLSFSVPPGVRVPPSLQNMYKELASDLGCRVPNHGCLEKWCRQGVLLLNASLTVRAKLSNSHAGKGWEGLTSAALSTLAKQRNGIVFLLWGKYAQDRCAKLDMKRHHVLKSVHPSPLSAHRGFLGCKHFSATNKLLKKSGLPPIDWQIDNV